MKIMQIAKNSPAKGAKFKLTENCPKEYWAVSLASKYSFNSIYPIHRETGHDLMSVIVDF